MQGHVTEAGNHLVKISKKSDARFTAGTETVDGIVRAAGKEGIS